MTDARRTHSKISRLPESLRAAIHDALIRRGATYDDLTGLVSAWVRDAKVAAADAPSRAGLARYGKHFLSRMEQLHQAREQAKAVVANAEEYGMALDEAATNMVLNEIMSIFMSRHPGKPMSPADIARIAAGLGKLQSSSVQREKLKSDFARQVNDARIRAVAAARAEGLSEESAERIGDQIKIYLPDNQRKTAAA